ncbi:hypothetical protein [Tsukamurella hominis]|uniref:hypothetical protein n=1 Tax=Tsukamurella hominis TaxID=1970232 RepID=UPI0039E992EB
MNAISRAAADWLDWNSCRELSAADVAEQLGITEASVATARRRYPEFPAAVSPTNSGPIARWKASEIYDYQLATSGHPRRRPLPVPRLHPRTGTNAPTLLETVTLRYEPGIGFPLRWVAHVIETYDCANPVVLAFRIGSTSALPAERELAAIEHASVGYVPPKSTFVLAEDAAPRAHLERLDPRIRALDNGRYWRAHWTDLAAALPGFPLPWWPKEFRNPHQMRIWRPGDAPHAITLRASRRPLPAPVNLLYMSDDALDAWSRSNHERTDYSYLGRLVPQAHPVVTITYRRRATRKAASPRT